MATRRASTPPEPEVLPPAPRGADPEAWRLLVTQGGAVTSPEETAEDEIENDFAAKIRECLGSSGDAMRVDLFRYSTFTKSREHCRSYDAEEFLNGNYELVRREFGGGTYEWRLIGSTGIKARGHMKLAQQVNPAPASAPAPAASAAAELAPVLGAIMQGQQALAETLARIASTPAAPPVDPMAQMMQMMTLAKTMREAFAPAPAPAAPSGLAALKEAAETARMLRDIAGESETETDPLLSTARPLIGALTDMLARKNNPGDNAAPLQPVQLPATVTRAPAPEPSPEERDEMDMQALLTRLVQMAKENQPTEKGGEEIFHYLPDSLLPFLAMPNWFDLLVARIPELAPHRAWLEAAKSDADKRFAAAG